MGPVALPTVPDYPTVYGSLGSVYDPEVKLVNQQIGQLAPEQAAEQASLDQAKVNAFRDINTDANRKGILFSGFSPDQQATYIGTKYLPAVANLKTSFANRKTTLLDKINQINATRAQQAQGIVSDSQKALSDAQYKNAQFELAQEKLARSSTSSKPTTADISSAAGAINSKLSKLRGRDGYVSPYDYNDALSAWAADGLPTAQFKAIFGKYQNPKTKGYQK